MTAELIDPGQAFLEHGYDPGTIEHRSEHAMSLDEVALLVAAAFFTYRALWKTHLLAEPIQMDRDLAPASLVLIAQKLLPIWVKMTTPAFLRAYQLGSTDLVSKFEMEYLAQTYATSVGQYINDTSSEALLTGYQAMLNRRWSPDLAYRRAAVAYGLDSKQMKSYVANVALNADKPNFTEFHQDASEALVDRYLGQRAKTIADNDTWTAAHLGKQVYWLAQVATGEIPATSRKIWRTAEDERVCPVCAPLDGKHVQVDHQFRTDDGKVWGPALHPSCRCTMELMEQDDYNLAKAFDYKEHPRGGNTENRGQFSHIAGVKPVKERDPDPVVDDLLRQVREEIPHFTPQKFGTTQFSGAHFTTAAPKFSQAKFEAGFTTPQFTRQEKAAAAKRRVIILTGQLEHKVVKGEVVESGQSAHQDVYMAYPHDTSHLYTGMTMKLSKSNPGNYIDSAAMLETQLLEQGKARYELLHDTLLSGNVGDSFYSDWEDLIAEEIEGRIDDLSDSDVDQLIDLLHLVDHHEIGRNKANIKQAYFDGDPATAEALELMFKTNSSAAYEARVKEFVDEHMDQASIDIGRASNSVFFAEGTSSLITEYIPSIFVIRGGDQTEFVGLDESDYSVYHPLGDHVVDGYELKPTGDIFTPKIRYVYFQPAENIEKSYKLLALRRDGK